MAKTSCLLKGLLANDAWGSVCEGSGAQALDRMRFSMDRGGGERPRDEKHVSTCPVRGLEALKKRKKNTSEPIWSKRAEQQRKRRRRPSRTPCFTRVSGLFRDSGEEGQGRQGRNSSVSGGGGRFREAQKYRVLRYCCAFRWPKPRVFEGSALIRRPGQCLRGVGGPRARQD